ncbi:MAG: NFACT family protein [Candidatus Cloacimonetes bacterium]|nr:NFACT family protein [Candidatus Cloacimonadota bacterium]
MEYRYLRAWLQHCALRDLTVSEICSWQDQVAINFRRNPEHLQINLSENSFAFLTSRKILPFENQHIPEIFNRKLVNTRVKDVSILPYDRIITVVFQDQDIKGEKVEYHLILEFIRPAANVILTSREGIILGIWKKQKGKRILVPGNKYLAPPVPEITQITEISYPLSYNYQGVIVENSSDNSFTDLNKLFSSLYYEVILDREMNRVREFRKKELQKIIQRKEKKLTKLEDELKEADREKEWQEIAELLKTNLHLIKKGMNCLIVKNYYREGYPDMEIILRPELNPVQNLERYFKKYHKARSGRQIIRQQMERTRKEIEDLQSKIIENDISDVKDLQADRGIGQGSAVLQQTKLRSLPVSEDWEILVGRNNRENDLLTGKIARPQDWWFHTRIYHGSHIILRNLRKQVPPPDLINLCCRLAAYYSKAKHAKNVPVDYTQVRYVRKPKGSPPGFVVYSHHRTIFADPLDLRGLRALL